MFNSDYRAIKVGVKNLDDAVITLGAYKTLMRGPLPRPFGDKCFILKALVEKDLPTLRQISNFYYDTNGIYERVCNLFAFLYRYDWYTVPEIYNEEDGKENTAKNKKVLKEFAKMLRYLDASYIKKTCGEIALNVMKNGAYYGYVTDNQDAIILQQLPNKYCRSRYSVGGQPAIEFDMRYFDSEFQDLQYRMRVLNLFPEEFKKGYILYKSGRLKQDYYTDTGGWYLLTPGRGVKFNWNGSDVPPFVNVVPYLIDLDEAQDLDRRKTMQKLLKILVQKLPMDKNGDLIFDIDEARDIHNNAVEMLKRAVGVDVLTTFADVEALNMTDKNVATTTDDLEKVERAVFNAFGISQNLFNTDGNLSLEKSILNDESSARNLLLQFEMFFDRIIQERSSNKRNYMFKFYMLETTQYNYKDLSKLYKEQTQIGYSKILPQIALGHSQSFILNTAHFENELLNLAEIMIPPMMSSTMNGKVLGNSGQGNKSNQQISTSDKQIGRPEKPDDQKATKTIQNKEAMS